jgi:hypothetical protein
MEVGLVSSLLSISSFAVSLTQNLYRFANTTADAHEQVHRIARNVGRYSAVLELLADNLKEDESAYPQRALDFAKDLESDSCELLESIESLLPDRQRYRDNLSFQQRIAWNFKKTNVDGLMADLNHLKSTVQIFIGVLGLGRKYRSYKMKKTSRRRWRAVRVAFVRVENIIIEHIDMSRGSNEARAKQSAETENHVEVGRRPVDDRAEPTASSHALARTQQGVLELLSAASRPLSRTSAYDAATVLEHTPGWTLQLLREWSSVLLAPDGNDEDFEDDPLQYDATHQRLLTPREDDEEDLALRTREPKTSSPTNRMPSLALSDSFSSQHHGGNTFNQRHHNDHGSPSRNDSTVQSQGSRQAYMEDDDNEGEEPSPATSHVPIQQMQRAATAPNMHHNRNSQPILIENRTGNDFAAQYQAQYEEAYLNYQQALAARQEDHTFARAINIGSSTSQPTRTQPVLSNNAFQPIYIGHQDEKTKTWHRFVRKGTSEPVTSMAAYMTSPDSYEMVPDPIGPPSARKQVESKSRSGRFSKGTTKSQTQTWWDPIGGNPTTTTPEGKDSKMVKNGDAKKVKPKNTKR